MPGYISVLIAGKFCGELKRAGEIAVSRGAKLSQANGLEDILGIMRQSGRINLIMAELPFDIERLVRMLRQERFHVPVIACGVTTGPTDAAQAVRAGASDFLPLPPDPEIIAAMLEAASGEAHALLASDPAMVSTIRRAERVAASDASILITGESGTGKEILARFVHRKSPRAAGPFVALNCAAIPEALLESELFGHEKGAFSGAIGRRVGKFEAAHGGTILLDEISEIDIRLQAKLLRVIQEREVDRLGGNAPVKVNVRVLATSNRDLRAEAAAGRFRQDLFFRLNVVSLQIPSLRERPADVNLLADHYAHHYSALNGKRTKPFSREAYALLNQHNWPGNVRELENTVHRAILLAAGEVIGYGDIELPDVQPTSPASQGSSRAGPLVGQTMNAVERDLILNTLHHTFGNRTHAATMLGISIRCLRNKLREYSEAGASIAPAPNSYPA